MKILHVITAIQKAAGTSVFCCELCNELARRGHDVTIAVSVFSIKEWYKVDSRVRLTSMNDVANGSEKFDIVHMHGLWQTELHHFVKWALRQKIPMVWSPHGSLTEWAFRYKWWKKLPAWWLYQKRDLKHAAFIHVTAESEIADVKRVGLNNGIIVVPLGVNLTDDSSVVRLAARRISKERRVSFIGRVAPIKGLANLLKAFAAEEDKKKTAERAWRLVITGPDQEGHTSELRSLARDLEVEERVEFTGPKFGDELQTAYDEADIFVLPSYSENFGSVVIEALAHGVPVITTKGAPWKELEEYGCGWWIDVGVEPLAKALAEAMSLTDNERHEMGERGRKLVEEKYTWDAVTTNMLKGYEDVIRGCQ